MGRVPQFTTTWLRYFLGFSVSVAVGACSPHTTPRCERGFNVIKLRTDASRLSFLHYPGFFERAISPHNFPHKIARVAGVSSCEQV
jgi:hypothetical protein